MTIEVYDVNNKRIDTFMVHGQEHIDICPYKGKIRQVYNTLINNIRTYYIVVQN